MLTSVDLFTGIGGFALGLSGIARPFVYCDSDQEILNTLRALVADGRLPRGKIVEDINDTRAIVAAVGTKSVDLITCGCVYLSSRRFATTQATASSSLPKHLRYLSEPRLTSPDQVRLSLLETPMWSLVQS